MAEFKIDEFFQGLQKTLEEAVKPPESKGDGDGKGDDQGVTKEVHASLVAKVDAIEKAITGEDDGSVRALVKAIGEAVQELHKLTVDGEVEDSLISVMSKVLDRIEALEGGSAVRKSLDDAGKDGTGKDGGETDVKKGKGDAFDALAAHIRANKGETSSRFVVEPRD